MEMKGLATYSPSPLSPRRKYPWGVRRISSSSFCCSLSSVTFSRRSGRRCNVLARLCCDAICEWPHGRPTTKPPALPRLVHFRASVVRAIQQAITEGIFFGRGLATQRTRQQTRHRINQHHRRQLATRQHIISDLTTRHRLRAESNARRPLHNGHRAESPPPWSPAPAPQPDLTPGPVVTGKSLGAANPSLGLPLRGRSDRAP
jgi:hypothetical protein